MVKKISIIIVTLLFLLIFYVLPVTADVRVYDANNKYLGIYIVDYALLYQNGFPYGPGQKVAIPPYGVAVIGLDMNGNGSLASSTGAVFESNDCSGTPYTKLSSEPFIFTFNNKYYSFALQGIKKTFIYKSTLVPGSNNQCSSTPTNTTIGDYCPFMEIPSESLPFPFKYPIHFEFSSSDISGKIGLPEAINALQTAAGLK
jgi:hypothetical protein